MEHVEALAHVARAQLDASVKALVVAINRLGLGLSRDQLDELRKLGFLERECFVFARSLAKRMQTELFTAENSLEVRLRLSVSRGGYALSRLCLFELRLYCRVDCTLQPWRQAVL